MEPDLACSQAVDVVSPRNTIRRHIGRALDRSGPCDKTTGWGVGRAERERERGFSLSSPRPPPLARFVDPQPGPDLAARIQDGDLITNSSFFDHPTAPKPEQARSTGQQDSYDETLNLSGNKS